MSCCRSYCLNPLCSLKHFYPKDLSEAKALEDVFDSAEEVLPLLQKFQQELGRGDNVDWKILREILLCIRLDTPDSHFLRKFLIGFLKLFDVYKCQDVSLIADVFEIASSLHLLFDGLGERFRNPGLLSSMKNSKYDPQYGMFVQRLNEHLGHECEFSTYFTLRYENDVDYYFGNSNSTLAKQVLYNVEFLKLLLKFGVMLYIDPGKQQERFYEYLPSLLHNKRAVKRILRMKLDEREFGKNFPVGLKRFYYIMWDLNLFAKMREEQDPETVKNEIRCFELMFSAIPAPRITCDEVKKTLCEMYFEEDALPLWEEYIEQFPDRNVPITPRDLKHLCRYEIRQLLREAKAIHYGIPSLPISDELKDYLLLKDSEHYGKVPIEVRSTPPEIPSDIFIFDTSDSIISFFDSL